MLYFSIGDVANYHKLVTSDTNVLLEFWGQRSHWAKKQDVGRAAIPLQALGESSFLTFSSRNCLHFPFPSLWSLLLSSCLLLWQDSSCLHLLLFTTLVITSPHLKIFNLMLGLGTFPGGPGVKTSPFNARSAGSITGWGAKIPYASRPKNQNKKQKESCNKFNKEF